MANDLRKGSAPYKDLGVDLPTIKWGWEEYIEKYFHGIKSKWNGQKHPYIFYKFLFRKFLKDKWKLNNREVAQIEGYCCKKKPHRATIRDATEQDPNHWPLKKSEITDALIFLNRNMDRSLQNKLQTKIKAKINQGYTTGDVARHCLVHESIIHKIQNGQKVPYQALKLIEDELL